MVCSSVLRKVQLDVFSKYKLDSLKGLGHQQRRRRCLILEGAMHIRF